MAVVRASADEERDYLSNFEPLVTDRLKHWAPGVEVSPEALATDLRNQYDLPSFPVNVAKTLLRRAESREEVHSTGGQWWPRRPALDQAPDLTEKRREILRKIDTLTESVIAYAQEHFEINWSENEALAALVRLTEDFGPEIALARRSGEVGIRPDQSLDSTLLVVHGYARKVLECNPDQFDSLVSMVQGTMLVSAIYFTDVGHMSKKLKDLRVFLDTGIVLRALGLAPPEITDGVHELLDMLSTFKVPTFVFSHTIEEISGVLIGVASELRRGTGLPRNGITHMHNREAIDSAVKQGLTASEIEQIDAELESRLLKLGIGKKDTPRHREANHLDESRFNEVLGEIPYRSDGPRDKDRESLTAIDRFRGDTRPRSLPEANALFLTSNAALTRLSRKYFKEENRNHGVPHCLLDTQLTVELWVRSPHPPPQVPRKLLIADCYAALSPSSTMWERWVSHIARLKEEGTITGEEVQTLIYHRQARSALFEVTRGDPQSVASTTASEVLRRFEETLTRPLVEGKAAAEIEAADSISERNRLATQMAALEERLRSVEVTSNNNRAVVRRVAGLVMAVLYGAIVGWLTVAGGVDDRTTRRLIGITALVLMVVTLAWAFRWSMKWSVVAGLGTIASIATIWNAM